VSAETGQRTASIIINQAAAAGDLGVGEGSSTTSIITTAAPPPITASSDPADETVMGRKKIQIAQIADERNRQVLR